MESKWCFEEICIWLLVNRWQRLHFANTGCLPQSPPKGILRVFSVTSCSHNMRSRGLFHCGWCSPSTNKSETHLIPSTRPGCRSLRCNESTPGTHWSSNTRICLPLPTTHRWCFKYYVPVRHYNSPNWRLCGLHLIFRKGCVSDIFDSVCMPTYLNGFSKNRHTIIPIWAWFCMARSRIPGPPACTGVVTSDQETGVIPWAIVRPCHKNRDVMDWASVIQYFGQGWYPLCRIAEETDWIITFLLAKDSWLSDHVETRWFSLCHICCVSDSLSFSVCFPPTKLLNNGC